jgi:hypothetical protein
VIANPDSAWACKYKDFAGAGARSQRLRYLSHGTATLSRAESTKTSVPGRKVRPPPHDPNHNPSNDLDSLPGAVESLSAVWASLAEALKSLAGSRGVASPEHERPARQTAAASICKLIRTIIICSYLAGWTLAISTRLAPLEDRPGSLAYCAHNNCRAG